MSENPLDDGDGERERKIRECAHHLWDLDGRPHGRSEEFWERAQALVGLEESAGAAQLPNPLTTGEVPGAVMVEEAALEENLGEFPGRFTDQGDREQTPRVRRTAGSAG